MKRDTDTSRRTWLWAVAAALCLCGGVACVVRSCFLKERARHQEVACISNMRNIQGAIEHWAMEENRASGSPVNVQEVAMYFIHNRWPTCPAGGAYTVQFIGDKPRCSVHTNVSLP